MKTRYKTTACEKVGKAQESDVWRKGLKSAALSDTLGNWSPNLKIENTQWTYRLIRIF